MGRATDNDLVLEDPSVEPHQVVLTRTGDHLELRGLFAGTTKVNDSPSQKVQLKPGDVITLGSVKLRLMKIAAAKSGALKRGETRSLGRGARPTRAQRRDEEATRTGTEAVESRTTRRMPGPDEVEGKRARERDARRARALARARQLSDEIMHEDDFEVVFERLAGGFLDVFSADRAVTVLFEEDGINPLMVVERRRDGTAEGTGIAQEIISRCLQVRSVIRVAGGYQGLGGLAAPLLTESRALGMLYFERVSTPGAPLGADDVHLMALLTNVASLKIAPLVR